MAGAVAKIKEKVKPGLEPKENNFNFDSATLISFLAKFNIRPRVRIQTVPSIFLRKIIFAFVEISEERTKFLFFTNNIYIRPKGDNDLAFLSTPPPPPPSRRTPSTHAYMLLFGAQSL